MAMTTRENQAVRAPFGRGIVVVGLVALLAGCERASAPVPAVRNHPNYQRLPAAELLMESQRTAVMGRKQSLEHVRRTVSLVGPLVAESVKQPAIEVDLQAVARERRTTVSVLRQELQRLQEADLLLESGGDPNAVSVAGAVGVAQWLAGTGQRAGLHVDKAEYGRITARAAKVRGFIAELRRRPAEWSRPESPGGTPLTRDQWLARYQEELRDLERQRLAADERYDPRKAIFAQTRYLARLWRRFGSLDWALQAYHGGERGVERTVSLFLTETPGPARPAGTRAVSFEEVYFGTSPRQRPKTFAYLYGRSDDHRYYWWRVLMAERALALYRKDPKGFEAEWRALSPGFPIDRTWYPAALDKPFAALARLQEAQRRGFLLPIPGAPAFAPHPLAPLDQTNESWYRAVRPETLAMLLRLDALYREEGGRSPLRVTGAATTVEYARLEAARKAAEAAKKPGNSPAVAAAAVSPAPSNADPPLTLHAAGLSVDVARPDDAWDRKVLEYALSRLGDRMRIGWIRDASAGGYHLCPNPAFADELVSLAGLKHPQGSGKEESRLRRKDYR